MGAVDGEMMTAIMRGDGDPSASRWPMGCGEEALLVRYHTGHGTVAPRGQVQFEIAAAYRHYHAALMYVILTGEPDPRHDHMFQACAEALDACEAALRPGNAVGQVFAAYARRGYRCAEFVLGQRINPRRKSISTSRSLSIRCSSSALQLFIATCPNNAAAVQEGETGDTRRLPRRPVHSAPSLPCHSLEYY